MNIISLHNFVESDVIIILVMQRPQIWECFRAKLNLGVCRKALENGKVRIVIGGVSVCSVWIFAQYS